jgi:hypothetical protein
MVHDSINKIYGSYFKYSKYGAVTQQYLLGCGAVRFSRSLVTFSRLILPPSSQL